MQCYSCHSQKSNYYDDQAVTYKTIRLAMVTYETSDDNTLPRTQLIVT